PEPRRAIGSPGQDPLAVGAEGHGLDRLGMRHSRSHGLAGRRVPESGGTVLAPGQDRLAVGAEGHGTDPPSMPPPGSQWAARRVSDAQSRAVRSPPPVRIGLPSGLKATARTGA